ncbi:toxin ParE1/3/4 [Hasllibacter halocynthiae]|uniref:Toxin ParE1/3/4 n=1 Tax=Hasllibacter halocynthiae TaxID=595589 RepID=A0A2T0WZI3_9RHOB|nr:type II toxin-antitoxin system RelE/ParE family toxin [Hasllibacter halocynthiae]PRY92077.1 toxin ParE1/3/4 [Hasllibacter halocynthiae]
MRLRPRARADLLAIRDWGTERWGEDRAKEFLEGLIEAIERLEAHPEMGRPREAFGAGLRSIRHRGYVIFYEIDGGRPVIVAVIHERRNLAALQFGDALESE